MNPMKNTENIPCPYCKSIENDFWGKDNGYNAVKCRKCSFVFVNPRPIATLIDSAVKTGTHSEEANSINVVNHRIGSKVAMYKSVFKEMFESVWVEKKPISWLDVGAGYGEILEAITLLAPSGSKICGLEPMKPKAENARKRGLTIHEGYIDSIKETYDFISLIDVFSHIPDFRTFLKEAKEVLNKNGEIFIETGNSADFDREVIPAELSLPDHLVFAGEKHMIGFLNEAGFEIIEIKKVRIDTVFGFIKDIIKKIIGRPNKIVFPYTSPYRSLLIRAKLTS